MNIVFLDGFTTQRGDIDDACLYALGKYQMYDRTHVDQLAERAAVADILITNKFVIDQKALAVLPKLKYIVVAATGFNNIHLDAVKERKIPVSNVRGYSTTSVVQQVFASLLEVLNKPSWYFDQVNKQRWVNCPDFCFIDHSICELSTLTLGIIGFGQIGSKLAEVGLSMGMKVLAYNKSKKQAQGVVFTHSLDDLLLQADVVSLHLPLSDESRAMINQNTLAKMKGNAILINTGRGPLIDENELSQHLKANPAFTAILDVLTQEPPPVDHPLLGLPNCHITPHIAWASTKARQQLVNGIAQNIANFRKGVWENRIYEF